MASHVPLPYILLHEMAHVAVRGNRHGKIRQNEMKRLIRLGSASEKGTRRVCHRKAGGPAAILTELYDASVKSGITWQQLRRSLGYEYGFVDNKGRVADQDSAPFLHRARRE
jgi:hypothetical protein